MTIYQNLLNTILLILISFLSGSLMISYWLGRIKGKDVRSFGNGNPGAINAFKAVGWHLGILAMLLDFLKGAIPIFLINHFLGISDARLIPIAIAPVLGHAYSPFLDFKGGKTMAVTFGIWSGLTLWEAPMVLGLSFIILKYVIRIKNDAWSVVLGMPTILIYLLLRNPDPILIMIFVLNYIIVIVKHRKELRIKIG